MSATETQQEPSRFRSRDQVLRGARRRVGLWGGLAGLMFSIWFRGEISPEGENIAEWVIKLPAWEVHIFSFGCGFLSWTFLARFLGHRIPVATLVMAVLGTPIAFILSLTLGYIYALPRIMILLSDPVGGFWIWLVGVTLAAFAMIVTIETIGVIVWLTWPAGMLLAFIGHFIMRRARLAANTVGN